MQKTVLISLIAFWALTACSKFERVRKSSDVKTKYEAAVKYFDKKDYYRASILLEDVIPLLKGDATAEDAQFKYAYTQYYQGQLTMSAYLFNKFYETFARSPHAEEARYMHAYSLYEDSPEYNLDQTNTFKAIDALQAFVNAYPKSEHHDKSAQLLKELREKLEKKAYEQAKLFYRMQGIYKAAVVTFNNFQKGFPDSDYNEEIAFRKLEAQYQLAQRSTEARQKERYESTIEFYEVFIDQYPQSRFLRDAERIYESAIRSLRNRGAKPEEIKGKTEIGRAEDKKQ
jgi:outer membrane protein assembly factor BamD